MKAGERIPKPARIGVAALGTVLALAFLLAFLAGARIQAAPLCNAGTGANPRIQAITVTSNLPISDTHPGTGVTKTVYFNNAVPHFRDQRHADADADCRGRLQRVTAYLYFNYLAVDCHCGLYD